jgi:hypothetical protein
MFVHLVDVILGGSLACMLGYPLPFSADPRQDRRPLIQSCITSSIPFAIFLISCVLRSVALFPPFLNLSEILSGEIPHVSRPAEGQLSIGNDLFLGQVMAQRPNSDAQFLGATIE